MFQVKNNKNTKSYLNFEFLNLKKKKSHSDNLLGFTEWLTRLNGLKNKKMRQVV